MPEEQRNDWLDARHPVHEAGTTGAATAAPTVIHNTAAGERELHTPTGVARNKGLGPWQRNERRLRGGDDALEELAPFDWERSGEGASSYQARKAQATYINFPDLLVTTVVGHLFRQAPTPEKGLSMGGLGNVREAGDRAGEPTRAELAWFNCDGVGNDGSQWETFWKAQARLAMATGHRWIFVESSAKAPRIPGLPTAQDELEGRRPYLLPLAASAVTNWHYEEGRLAFAVVRVPDRRPRLQDGKLIGNGAELGYLLLVRAGFQGFGEEYSAGGWFLFDHERKPTDRKGTWERTRGEIPLVPLFYERDSGSEDRPAISRSAITELGQIAVSYMNLSSAADYDAWEAASSVQIVSGADVIGFNTMIDQMARGTRWAPLPSPQAHPETKPEIHDGSSGSVAAEVFDKRLKQKFEEAKQAALQEATQAPESSGESKRAGFAENTAPRLASFAAEIEQAMNGVLHFLELRWGVTSPSAWCEWPREFDLAPLNEDIDEIFSLQERAGVKSPTLISELLAQAVRGKRLIVDRETMAVVEAELTVGAFEQQAADRQERAFNAEVDRPAA